MYIEIEGGADIGVAEEDADGLVIAFALDASGGEAVPEAVETHFGKAQVPLEFVEVATVCAWLRWRSCVGQDIEITTNYLLQRTDQGKQVARHGNLTDGILGLRLVHDEFGVLLFPVHQVDALNGLVYSDYA